MKWQDHDQKEEGSIEGYPLLLILGTVEATKYNSFWKGNVIYTGQWH